MVQVEVCRGGSQSTRPRGARRSSYLSPCSTSKFQSTRPRGARRQSLRGGAAVKKFQSTRPRGARQGLPRQATHPGICFNPRAHAGRDATSVPTAPPRSRFQSTRPRGARRARPSKAIASSPCFNPRAHAGRDGLHLDKRDVFAAVSIHAPTRGATLNCAQPARRRMFQSTRPRGARHVAQIHQHMTALFQSTRPRGARRELAEMAGFHPKFQSTRPRGARQVHAARERLCVVVSIHAPTRGATKSHFQHRSAPSRFNPRAHAGRDPCFFPIPQEFQPFQSTRPRGARPSPTKHSGLPTCFNPRAHAGRGGFIFQPLLRCFWFQSTRPRGARP